MSGREEKVQVKQISKGLLDDLMSQSDDITAQQLIKDQNTIDENIDAKSEFSDVFVHALWDSIAGVVEREKYQRTSAFMKDLSLSIKGKMIGYQRKGRKETADMIIADMQKRLNSNEGELERLGVKRR